MGGVNSGKSSLMRILINQAVKREWKPIYCELEPNLNEISFPGVLSTAVIDKYFFYDENGFDRISFFYGNTEIDQN